MKHQFLTEFSKEYKTIKHKVELEQGADKVCILVDGFYILEILDDGYIRRTGCVPSHLGLRTRNDMVVITTS